jgi:hypothetical protein
MWGCAFQVGCTTESLTCNSMAWSHVVSIRLAPPVIEPGKYIIKVVNGTVTRKCDLTLTETLIQDCSDGITIGGLTASAAPSEIAWLSLTLGDAETPQNALSITITETDGTRNNYTIKPDYAVDEPNGEGCGERKQATVDLVR